MVWLQTVKQRLGPLWWYTAILFCVQRLGDVINAFAGLYLVPRYVPQEELGAVLPLTQVGGALGLPITVLMVTFSKYLNTYATRGEYGKVKRLLIDVFVFAALLFVGTMIYARFFMPLVFERMRVTDGRLGVLVIACGVLGSVGAIFSTALLALKKFRLMGFVGLLSAPLRLVTLLVCMPIRALSGYFVGQLVPTLFSIAISVWGLKDLLKARTEPYWRQDGVNMLKYAVPVAVGLLLGTLQSLVETFVIRHRLPDVESAGYYLVSRFAELGSYVGLTLLVVLFPLASEQHERKDRSQKLILQGMGLSLMSGLFLAFVFWSMGQYLFSFVPAWCAYVSFVPHLAVLTAICALRITANCFTNYEMACHRFGFLSYVGFISSIEAVFLYGITGYSFFEPWLPSSWIAWMADLKAARLDFVLQVMFWFSVLPLICMGVHLVWQRRQRSRSMILCHCDAEV